MSSQEKFRQKIAAQQQQKHQKEEALSFQEKLRREQRQDQKEKYDSKDLALIKDLEKEKEWALGRRGKNKDRFQEEESFKATKFFFLVLHRIPFLIRSQN